MKKIITILLINASCLYLIAQKDYHFKFSPDTQSYKKLEVKFFPISASEYNVQKQKVVSIKTINDKEYSLKSDSIKKIFETKCSYIFSDNNCVVLNLYDKKDAYKVCPNINPEDEKQSLNFYFTGIDNRFATLMVTPYECAVHYIIDLKTKISYPGYDNYTNESKDIIYGFLDYISFSIYIYDLKNNKDITLTWGGKYPYIKDFYVFQNKFLRLNFKNYHTDTTEEYVSIQFRN